MKEFFVSWVIFAVVSAFALEVMASKYTFDLSKGPVVFQYTITGAYNPIRITVTGENGVTQLFIDTLAYRSSVSVESLILNVYQMASVHGLNLDVRQLAGQLVFLAETGEGTFSINMQTTEGNVTVTIDCGDVPGNPREIEIRAGVQAAAKTGQVVIEDSRPAPSAVELVSQMTGIPPAETQSLIDQFGAQHVLKAAEAALFHKELGQPLVPVGGAGTVAGTIPVTEFRSLNRGEVFNLYLRGTQFRGQIQDSTLFLWLFHPSSKTILNGLRVIITVVRQNSTVTSIAIWDRAHFDFNRGCYVYSLKNQGLTPGDYWLYIDVEHFQTIKLPLAVAMDGQVMTWAPKYEGSLRDSTVYLRLYHPVTLQPIRTMPVELAVLKPSAIPNGSPELVWSTQFVFSEETDEYVCPLSGRELSPGAYTLAINLGGLQTIILPVVVTPMGDVLPAWR